MKINQLWELYCEFFHIYFEWNHFSVLVGADTRILNFYEFIEADGDSPSFFDSWLLDLMESHWDFNLRKSHWEIMEGSQVSTVCARRQQGRKKHFNRNSVANRIQTKQHLQFPAESASVMSICHTIQLWAFCTAFPLHSIICCQLRVFWQYLICRCCQMQVIAYNPHNLYITMDKIWADFAESNFWWDRNELTYFGYTWWFFIHMQMLLVYTGLKIDQTH